MRIVQALPPLFDEIDAAFKVRGRPILFAWGGRIFNPAGVPVPPELMAHERVHGERQLQGATDGTAEGEHAIGLWWGCYVKDPVFRFEEELLAHVAEFKMLCDCQRHAWRSERNMRRTLVRHVARKLAAPLYGNLINVHEAKQLLLAA